MNIAEKVMQLKDFLLKCNKSELFVGLIMLLFVAAATYAQMRIVKLQKRNKELTDQIEKIVPSPLSE